MIIKNAVRLWMLLSLVFVAQVAQTIELRPVHLKPISDVYKVLFEEVGHLEYRMWGHAFLEKKDIEKITPKNLKKAYLIWGGKTEERFREKIKKILVGQDAVKATAFFITKDEGTKIAYVAAADITNIRIQKIEMNTKHEIGGYGVVEIWENKISPKRYLGMRVGITRLKPGEIYDVELLKKEERKGLVSRVSTIGGGAIEGNGSANMLNGLTFSGKEEWNGSSGKKWDVDTFDVEKFKILSDEGLIWSIDPLLQWIYPMGAVVQIDMK